MKLLLEKGFKPVDQENGGSSMIQKCLREMSWSFDWFRDTRKYRNLDTARGRTKIKMIEMPAENGGRWVPFDRSHINDARRSMIKMAPSYTVDFLKIMAKYGACSREDAEQLLRTPAIKAVVADEQKKIAPLLKKLS